MDWIYVDNSNVFNDFNEKSSNPAAKACKPICSSCAGRLLLEVIVAWVGEFIISLQIVGTDLQSLRLRMPAQIQRRQGRGALLPYRTSETVYLHSDHLPGLPR